MTNNIFKKLPCDVLGLLREYASDKVGIHPSAALLKTLTIAHRLPAGWGGLNWIGAGLVVSGAGLTSRQCKCSSAICIPCALPNGSCQNAIMRTLPTASRRYIYNDFTRNGGWSHFSRLQFKKNDVRAECSSF